MKTLPYFFAVMVLLFSANAEISHDSGFYESSFEVTVTIPPEGSARYTLDAQDPLDGELVAGPILIEERGPEPSELAANPEITLFPYMLPESTGKATILRVAEFDEDDNLVAQHVRTYFIGWSPEDFNAPVFSVVINPEYLDDYEIGMYIKGKTYYDDLEENGGNPLNPFRPANWNNKDLRWPAHYEIFIDGSLEIADPVRFYTSGRWSAALAMKSFKINYHDSVGASSTDYPFFGDETTPFTKTFRLRTGSQDMDSGILMRDCLAALLFRDTEQEVMNCRFAVLFLNGEYWGSYNMREDVDNWHLGFKYGIDRNDVVLLEMDGLIDEGAPGDNLPYFELRDWLMENSLETEEDYEYFVSQVNELSLIDYYTCHMFSNNLDFPNDHYFWRNKNPETQVPGTPIDGRWQYFCKDVDQGFGLFSRGASDSNTLLEFLNSSERSGWSTLFLRKAFENAEFRSLFLNRSLELLNTRLHPDSTVALVETMKQEKGHEIPRQAQRWINHPSSFGSWNNKVEQVKEWLTERHYFYTEHLLALYETPIDPPEPPVDPPDPPEPPTPPGEICYEQVNEIPPVCEGGIITEDINMGSGRLLACENEANSLVITAWDKEGGQYFEMYKQSQSGSGLRICLADTCIAHSIGGFARSPDYPICVEGDEPPIDPPEPPEPPTPPGEICYAQINEIPPVCEGGIITEDINMGSGRLLACENEANSLVITAWDKEGGQYFEMYKQSQSGSGLRICLADTCISSGIGGFARSPDYPICVEGDEPIDPPEDPIDPPIDPPEPPETSVSLFVKDWYPKGTHYVFVCEEEGYTATTYQWDFGNGMTQTTSADNVYHIFEPGEYTVLCTASNGASESATLDIVAVP
jgi:hypothetical protein